MQVIIIIELCAVDVPTLYILMTKIKFQNSLVPAGIKLVATKRARRLNPRRRLTSKSIIIFHYITYTE